MRTDRALIAWLALILASFAEHHPAVAANGPGTLMQWGYGPEVQGGPDLSEPLVTDRPDFTESSVTVGMGVVQVEGGYTFTYDDNEDGSTQEHSYPETLFRLGMLAEWFELRLGWNFGASAETVFGGVDESLAGAEDLYIGSKFALTPQSGCLPETGLILQMTVPTGASDFTAGEVLPGVNFVYGWDVTDDFSIGGGTQANRALDDNGEDFYVEFAQSITTGCGWTEELGSYAEWYMFAPAGADTAENQQYFNAGLTYLITDNIQWDIRAGVGLNEAADDFFTGSGLSIRMY
ncbi:MAG: transporter [Pirellulales bacterium]